MGLSGFNIWMGGGGRIFHGDGGIMVVVRYQGGVLGAGIHEVFVYEVGVLQGMGYCNG